jgi:hypothetical protein
VILHLTRYMHKDYHKEDKVGRACDSHGIDKKCVQGF